jgi:hypothetical protein
VRYAEVTRYRSKSFSLGPVGDFGPVLKRDAWTFDCGSISPNSRAPSRVEESFRKEDRDEGPRDNVYLA